MNYLPYLPHIVYPHGSFRQISNHLVMIQIACNHDYRAQYNQKIINLCSF